MVRLTRQEVIYKALEGERLKKTVDLQRTDLSGHDLKEINLHGAYLQRAVLSFTNLSGINLSGAKLAAAYLKFANLNCANLSGADLRDVNFANADLSNADITGANIWNISTTDWKIDGIKCEYVYSYLGSNEREKEKRIFPTTY